MKGCCGKPCWSPAVVINNFCWSVVQDLKGGYNLRSSFVCVWWVIEHSVLVACFPPTYGIFCTVKRRAESLLIYTLWRYQQSYVLCCSAWINFITCCLFLNWHSWTSELTLVLPASLVQGCSQLQLKALLYMCMTLKSAELSVSFKSH